MHNLPALICRIVPVFAALVAGTLALHAAGPVAYEGLTYHAPPCPLPEGAATEDWPRFLGVRHNATSRETKLLKNWPEGGPKKVWEIACGEGYTCPVLADERLVYFHRVGEKEILDCLEPETGKRFWRLDYAAPYRDRYGFSPGPRGSPVIDGGRIYVAGVTAVFHCLDLGTGREIWKRDLMEEFNVPQYFFGYGPSPFVWRDRVIVNVGGKGPDGREGTCVAAFDKRTGKTLWTAMDCWGASYASPVVARLRGKNCALVMAAGESRPGRGGLLTINAATGEVFDRFPWRARRYESVLASSPTILDDRRVFISECYEKGGVLLEFDENLKANTVWTEREFGMHWMTPLHLGGHLYGFAGRNNPAVELMGVEVDSGEVAWNEGIEWREGGRVSGLFRASLLAADGRVFGLGEDGVLAELTLSPKGADLRQRTRLFTARETWTLPALHRGLLYVCQNTRDLADGTPPRLICYDLRGEK